jgi:hypothetical protein
MDKNIIIIFFISIVALLLITSAGMTLNDEWMTAQELRQLNQGHQITFNEGKYGYYVNGSASPYITRRYNMLMYPIVIPLLSLPAMKLFSFLGEDFRIFILIAWITFGATALYLLSDRMKRKYLYILTGMFVIAIIANLLLYHGFPFGEAFTPDEVTPMVFTNVLMFGALIATIYTITKEIWKNITERLFATFASTACSSAIFWTGTTKDHILTMLLVCIIALLLIKFSKNKKSTYIVPAAILSGITLWVRPEVGIGIIIAIFICSMMQTALWRCHPIIYVKRSIIVALSSLIGAFPFFLNNIIVTGSFFITPFMMSNRGYANYLTTTYYGAPLAANTPPFSVVNMTTNTILTLVSPSSGAAGLVVIIAPAILAIIVSLLVIRRLKPTNVEAILFIISIFSIAFYLYKGTIFFQQTDAGIFPDMRYFTPMYIPSIIMSMSIFTRILNIDTKKMLRAFKNSMILSLLLSVIFSAAIIALPSILSSQQAFNGIMSAMVAMPLLGIGIALAINDIRNKTNYTIFIIIPLMIAVAFSWNIMTAFLYNSVKMCSYPMLLPASEFVQKMIFPNIV